MLDDLLNRYVRQIYDAIDKRQYKAAIKLCLHKKIAHLDLVQVLRAHCLERAGKVDEALEICRRVQKKNPTDDTLLNTMYLVFRMGGCESEMLPTFENACSQANPPNEELLQSLFFCYARKGDYLKQQQTAFRLYKTFNVPKYAGWACLSIVFQVRQDGAPAKMLALAERMLDKVIKDSRMNYGETLQLMIDIMQYQGKYEEAMNAFLQKIDGGEQSTHSDHHQYECHDSDCSHSNSPKTRATEGQGAYEEDIDLGPMQNIDRLSLEVSLAEKISDWDRCSSTTRKLLKEYNADDWTFLKQFIAAEFNRNDDLNESMSQIFDFLDNLRSQSSNHLLRGPALARVETISEYLCRVSHAKPSKKIIQDGESQLIDVMLKYMEEFCIKACCFSDLKRYFLFFIPSSQANYHVSESSRNTLLARIKELAEKSIFVSAVTEAEAERQKQLRKLNTRLLMLKTLRFLGYYNLGEVSIAQLQELVEILLKEYKHTSWLNTGAKGGQREVQYTDDLLLLAAHTLVDIHQYLDTKVDAAQKRTVLVEAASLLEFGLEKSPYNFQMKLMLCNIYGNLGACEVLIERHAELDIKHVQLDSLSYLVFDKLLQLCAFPESRRLCEKIQRLHRSTANEIPEYICRAYRLGVFSKVLDLTSFLREKMQNSHTLAIANAEMFRYYLMDAFANGPTKLCDFVISMDFVHSVEILEKALADNNKLSRNQHRDLLVEWRNDSLVKKSDFFAIEGAPLVDCDRSANFENSLLWLKLQLTVAKLISAASTLAEDEFCTLSNTYISLACSLKLFSQVEPDQKLWMASRTVVSSINHIISAVNGNKNSWAKAIIELEALGSLISGLGEQIIENVVYNSTATPGNVVFTVYGISTMSNLFSQAGLWVLIFISIATKHLSKKKGNQNHECVAVLRSCVKKLFDFFCELESKLKDLKLTDGASVLKVRSYFETELLLAEQKVKTNVVSSYKTLQTRMLQMIGDRVVALRNLLKNYN